MVSSLFVMGEGIWGKCTEIFEKGWKAGRLEDWKKNLIYIQGFLIYQINPHFLFNTLNNLYSLVYKKSDEAPDVVMKLSEIMRYMLYDAAADRVPLDKEMEELIPIGRGGTHIKVLHSTDLVYFKEYKENYAPDGGYQ